jgi:N-acetylmuramoyl-L-alanine amidase
MPRKVGFSLPAPERALGFVLGFVAMILHAPGLHAEDRAGEARAEAGFVASPQAIALARSAELEQAADRARLVFTLSKAVDATAFLLSSPDRVIVDLPQIDFAIPQPPAPRSSRRRPDRRDSVGLVASYRFGRLGPGRSRVILNLSSPARVLRVGCETSDGGTEARLVIELAKTDPASFRAAVQAARAGMTGIRSDAAPHGDPGQAEPSGKPIVVIDPGHGGIDSGAIVNGSVEKELVLGFAKAVATKLETDGRVTVVLTREDDTFVALSERVERARVSGAGLLVSIHADTLADATDVAGATVYTVSERASDAAAARLAEKENNADAAAGLDAAGEASEVSSILNDLTRRETRALSHVFARTILNYWKVAGRLNKNPQRSAGFMVLKAPDVPSVLLELGYLTNQKDDRALSSAEWREATASRVAEAIAAYFAERESAVASTTPARGSSNEHELGLER